MTGMVNRQAVIDEIEKHKNVLLQQALDKYDNIESFELYFLAHDHIKEVIEMRVPDVQCTECSYLNQILLDDGK